MRCSYVQSITVLRVKTDIGAYAPRSRSRFYTAVQALFHPMRRALVEPPAKVGKDEWVLVYGGSGECFPDLCPRFFRSVY